MTEGGRRLREQAARLGQHQTQRVLLAAVMRALGSALVLAAAFLLMD
ncbi:MAG: hypothetical protein HKN12_04350, partial [Gemmatimonadetes bacterium]|nr:hypothetical protein [Gemmatimonadota bacterium]